MSTTVIDIHILQSVPPSNLNRDDTGSPKTAFYGGVNRSRVSSQAWKRATRKAFEEQFDAKDLGVRTKRVVEILAKEIARQNAELSAEASVTLAADALKEAGIKLVTPKAGKGEPTPTEESGYLLFLARHQVHRLAELAVLAFAQGEKVDKKAAKSAVNSDHSIDIALFGRMVADDAELNVDAAAQVAHALGVHAVQTEFDYFTAVDDQKAESEETGAGMIGTVEFNSSTLYRYATVNVNGLHKSLGDEKATAAAVQAFVRAFITSMPTGKQNTFANRTVPDAVVVQIRSSQSINLVGAFEEPVVTGAGESRLGVASKKLAEHALWVDKAYGTSPSAAFVLASPAAFALESLGTAVNLEQLIDGVGAGVAAALGSS